MLVIPTQDDTMIVLGLKCYSHDTGAAILSDQSGDLALHAISEARLNRRKHSFTYPLMSIAYCLNALNLENLDQVDLVCIDRHIETWPEPGSQFGFQNAVRRHLPRYDDNHRWNYLVEQTLRLDRSKVQWVNHVDAHAASAFYVSPFKNAAVLVAEGGTGIYAGAGTNLKPIDRIGYLGKTYQDGRVLGETRNHFVNTSYFYDKITAHLGYDTFGAGQTMALAGFGNQFPRKDYLEIDEQRFDDFIINHDQTIFRMGDIPTFNGSDSAALVDEKWVNLARQAQETLEDDITYLAWLAKIKTGLPNLCLAGGAALNCIVNRKILDGGYFQDLFIQPASSDEGIPLGCALHGYYSNGGGARTVMETAYLGVPNDPASVDKVCRDWGVNGLQVTPKEIAERLVAGKIIGRVAEASEYGPRALGNRSILADPRPIDMKKRLNTEIKHREEFRPFAPSCLQSNLPAFFDAPRDSPFMLLAGTVSPEGKQQVPAVVHADGTSRVQTVSRHQNAGYHGIIQAFFESTGCPILLNTSFNDRDEPIVETYDDAISCFLRTGLDGLLLEDRLIARDQTTPVRDRSTLLANTQDRVEKEYRNLIARFCDMEAYVSLGERLSKKTS